MTTRPTTNWPYVVACLLVAVTAVLLCFGALVTTFDAAMAVPDWPGTYGHNMFLFPFAEWFFGPWDLFLEHGHRLLGASVGLITLVLAGIVWARPASTAVRAFTVAAVLLVLVQGGLGGARVLLDDKTVAKVHACTGPLFFAVAVAIAALSRRRAPAGHAAALPAIVALLVASYVQLVAGAQLRHLDATVEPRTFHWLVGFHVAGAAAVVGLTVAALVIARSRGDAPPVRRLCAALVAVVVLQIALGLGAWIVTWGIPSGWLPPEWMPAEPLQARSLVSAGVVTGHVVLGMLILGGAVLAAIAAGGLVPRRAGLAAAAGKAGAFA